MASMTTRKKQEFHNDDQYNTTPEIWEMISHLIPKDKILFEAFLKDNWSSKSAIILRDMGFNVVGDPTIDFFNELPEYDIIVSNPPYSMKKKIFERLAVLDKPFILILPISTITKQFVKVLERDKVQMIIPSKRMQFEKAGVELSRCWFDTCFLCYKMNLERDITFI
jgi:hypothetical protein